MHSLKPSSEIRSVGEFSKPKFALNAAVAALGVATLSPLNAEAAKLGLALEPIAGYEQTQKFLPSAHTMNRYFYGVRMRLGVPLVSVEAEYTRANDSETFADSSSTATQDDRLKVGLLSQFRLSSLLSLQARAGGQAQQSTITTNSVTSVYPIEYKPYAGGGLAVALGRQIQGSAGVTVIFRQWPDMSQNDYQATAGFTIKFGTSDL